MQRIGWGWAPEIHKEEKGEKMVCVCVCARECVCVCVCLRCVCVLSLPNKKAGIRQGAEMQKWPRGKHCYCFYCSI